MGDVVLRDPIVADPARGLDFEAFFEDLYERLFQALMLTCGDRAEAEDLAQEAMVRAYERWDRVRAADSPAAYVFRTALNQNRNRIRRAALAVRKGVSPDQPHDPTDAVLSRDEARRLLRALPIGLREAVVLVEWLGMSAEEAGGILRIQPVSVRGRIHRARELVRTKFGGRDE
jgi:RNA polymerase sigma factor (sigma-70 family)